MVNKPTREWTNEVYAKTPDVEVLDYLWMFPKGCTKEYREKFGVGDIFINGAVCLKCNDYIRSMNGHHFNTCKCGNLSVDGGSWYERRVFKEPDSYINIIEYYN